MPELFPIIDIPQDAREDSEQLGSKPKFWVSRADGRWLFKEARPNTGEDWSEKVAAELARLLHVNAATVELATYCGRHGCISKNFIDRTAGDALIHGNEVMAAYTAGYDRTKKLKQSDHTIANIIAAITALFTPDFADDALNQLAEYMVFDALIANTDRHHENWGLRYRKNLALTSPLLTIAPSFDHASSLGRELRDEARDQFLREDQIAKYVGKGRGGVYWSQTNSKGANPLELVKLAVAADERDFGPALRKICALTEDAAWSIINQIPCERASDVAKQFAHAMICFSLAELKKL